MFGPVQKALDQRIAIEPARAAGLSDLFELLQKQGLPQPRDEAWRYAPIRNLESQPLAPSSDFSDRKALDALALLQLPPLLPGYARIVIVDGAIAASLCDFVPTTRSSDLPTRTSGNADKTTETLTHNSFALLGRLLARSPLRIELGSDSPPRLQCVFVTTRAGLSGMAPTQVELQIHTSNRVDLVEEHVSLTGAGTFSNHVLDASLGANANLAWTRVLAPAADARHFETVHLTLAAGAAAHLTQLVPGNEALRSTLIASLSGAESHLKLHSVVLGDGSQQLDQHVLIDHRAPGVRSDEIYRGLATGRARVSFTGHNRVLPSAPQTDTRQSLRSLITGDGAEAIARPQLEILTDAVKASHGATVGTLDSGMMFYLLSRGLDPLTAQSLLKWAFLQDVLSHLQPAELRSRIESLLLARLRDPKLMELAR